MKISSFDEYLLESEFLESVHEQTQYYKDDSLFGEWGKQIAVVGAATIGVGILGIRAVVMKRKNAKRAHKIKRLGIQMGRAHVTKAKAEGESRLKINKLKDKRQKYRERDDEKRVERMTFHIEKLEELRDKKKEAADAAVDAIGAKIDGIAASTDSRYVQKTATLAKSEAKRQGAEAALKYAKEDERDSITTAIASRELRQKILVDDIRKTEELFKEKVRKAAEKGKKHLPLTRKATAKIKKMRAKKKKKKKEKI